MSEVKLNLIDSQTILCGITHGSIANSAVAALSAEPETVAELEAALARYVNPSPHGSRFQCFEFISSIDFDAWDAGVVIIDLAARIVAAESTYSRPGPRGQVYYHNGTHATDVCVLYRLPDDWRFVYSLAEYRGLRTSRAMKRAAHPPFDARPILFGRPLLEFIALTVNGLHRDPVAKKLWSALASLSSQDLPPSEPPEEGEANYKVVQDQVAEIHARWLMTRREDLGNATPREVLFVRQDLISFDLHTRELQWSLLGEGPPCLSKESFAYRYAGFGTHEWVVCYDLVRTLITNALHIQMTGSTKPEELTAQLEQQAFAWLEQPQAEYGGSIPANIIENERKRLPLAIHPRELIVDEECPVCQMMANESAMGGGPGFWHLDGSHMDDDFVFSPFRTREEWETHRREWEDFNTEFNRRWEKRQERSWLVETLNFDALLEANPLPIEEERIESSGKESDSAILM